MPWVFHNYKSTINDITIPEMLSLMYCDYPEMAQGSKTYEKLKPDIEEHIFSLVAKEKFGGARAAGLLDKSIYYARDKMRDMGILTLEP